MRAAVLAEHRKIVSTRLWWVLLLTMVLYMAFLGAVLAFPLATEGVEALGVPGDGGGAAALDARQVALTVYSVAPAFGYVFPAVVGALAVTGEFRHQTMTPTLLVEPRRTVVLAAKMLAVVPVGLLFGIAGTAGATGAGAAVLALTGNETLLADGEVLTTLARSVLALTLWAVVGVGFGAALPHQVAAIVTILAFTQFVEPILRIFLGAVDGLTGVAQLLPAAAGEAVAGASFWSTAGMSGLLPWWQGLLVLVGYGVGLALLGRLTTFGRDIT